MSLLVFLSLEVKMDGRISEYLEVLKKTFVNYFFRKTSDKNNWYCSDRELARRSAVELSNRLEEARVVYRRIHNI
jgi:hypothetical protein